MVLKFVFCKRIYPVKVFVEKFVVACSAIINITYENTHMPFLMQVQRGLTFMDDTALNRDWVFRVGEFEVHADEKFAFEVVFFVFHGVFGILMGTSLFIFQTRQIFRFYI